MLAVFLLGPIDAFVLVVVRVVLGSMFTGNMSTLMYSLSAGVVSVVTSSVLVELVYPKVSIVSISIVSAVLHNLTQNIVFCLVSNTPEMFSYMPWLALLGVLAGIIVGFAVWFILRMIPIRTFATMLGFDLNVTLQSEPNQPIVGQTENDDQTVQSETQQDDEKENGKQVADIQNSEQPHPDEQNVIK